MDDEVDVENGEVMVSVDVSAVECAGACLTARTAMPNYSPFKSLPQLCRLDKAWPLASLLPAEQQLGLGGDALQ